MLEECLCDKKESKILKQITNVFFKKRDYFKVN